MTLRNFSRRGPNGRSSTSSKRRRRVLVELLESRQLLAGDVGTVDALPTAEEAQFGALVLTPEGREVCLAFTTTSAAEGEGVAPPPAAPPAAPGPVDLTAAISNQPAGPLAPGAAFTSEITFVNTGPNDATATNLLVEFDANLTGISWEREIIRVQPATVATATLIGSDGFSVQGSEAIDLSGFSVSGGGDFNNDGIDDFIIGATEPDIGTTPQDGDAYVVFGTASGFPANLALSSLNGTNGFSIAAAGTGGSNLGSAVDNAGDVNNDGIDDIIVGAPGADSGGVSDSGEAYVIFGSASAFPAQISTASLTGANGFSIGGLGDDFDLGASVAGAGDINGDGIDDLIVGAPGQWVPEPGGGPGSRDVEGSAYVLFGKSTAFSAQFDLSTLPASDGFRISTTGVGDQLGGSVDGAGDVNNDGIADLVVGAARKGPEGDDSGAVFVIYGKNTAFSANVNVAGLDGSNGFAVAAPRAGHNFGTAVAGISDFNGDNIDDLLLADSISASGPLVSANSYVLFGSGSAFPATVDISTLNGTTGLVIEAPVADHPNPMDVSGNGDGFDVNGDGISDLLIGLAATQVTTSGVTTDIPGGGYVVFGQSTAFTSPLNLSTLNGTNGFLIESVDFAEQAGESIGVAGDVNGDGLDDVIVGAPFGSPGGNALAGESYVVFGRGSSISNDSGTIINETLDLFPGDQVIYRVSATIAPAATGSTVVTGTVTPGPGVTDDTMTNNVASQTTLIGVLDTTPPSITNVYAAGSAWNSVFVDGVDGGGVGTGNGIGIELSPGQRVANSGINRVFLQFSEDIGTLTPAQVELSGSAATYSIGSVNYSSSTYLAEVSILGTIGFDKVRLSVNDDVDDTAGNLLDGDGNGTPGGIFDLRFDVALGDIDGDGQVFTTDLIGWQAAFNSLPGGASYNPNADLDGDGQIFTTDLLIWQANFNQDLGNLTEPPASGFNPPPPPTGAATAEQTAPLAVDQVMASESEWSQL